MKQIFTLLLFLGILPLMAQDADYYRKIYTRPLSPGLYHAAAVPGGDKDAKVPNRWYFGVDGFLIRDVNTITSNFDELIGTESPVSASWGVNVGWVHHENWTMEATYTRSAIHNILIVNGYNPLRYNIQNDRNNLILRVKRRLLFNKNELRRPAFWIGIGGGIVPNSGRQKDYYAFEGYRQEGRWQPVDTLHMTSNSYISKSATLLAEVSAEYVVKVAKVVDLSIFARRQWGFGTSVTTDLVYSINNQVADRSTITGKGTGLNLGLSLRYVFHLGSDFSALDLR
ncbi:hypothetical protein [Dyadobacter sandarakinus]|uniref:Outer membrane protein beta-barrel domain-containing protein n=1 Tax=Dyadobacter sandarakinus TaxID=2747268 RepID=A0ABX7ICK6_9BACT|nr:hypothetical protein [Dyadobacter sandarakinus]QRR03710.1 hypothetical protein HWI92_23740 [Dyadobacter sandarakinus]